MRLAWRELAARPGRALALGLAVLVAATGFTVLTASSDAARLDTVGTVQARARTTYDILVRPPEARTDVEREERLIQPGFLSGTLGGITEEQWRTILDLPGVEVAAPLVVVGLVTPAAITFVDTTRFASRRRDTTWRLRKRWTIADGTQIDAEPDYVLSTPASLGAAPAPTDDRLECSEGDRGFSYLPQGSTASSTPTRKTCFFTEVTESYPGFPAHRVGATLFFGVPVVLVGVDPAQERALVGLDDAVDDGGLTALGAEREERDEVPVLLTTRTPVRASLDVTVEQLPARASALMTGGRNLGPLARQGGRVVDRVRIDADRAWRSLRRQLTDPRSYAGYVRAYTTVSAPSYREQPDGTLLAVPQPRPDLAKLYRFAQDTDAAPAGTELTPFRTLDTHEWHGDLPMQSGGHNLVSVGSFDPDRLGLDDVTAQLLSGYSTAPTRGPDGPVPGSTSLGALVQAPPAAITTLAQSRKLTGTFYGSPTRARPISAVRVRVDGVTGVDELSRERVRLVAQRIESETGLAVDVTVGASYTDRRIVQPATDDGQREQRLEQSWVQLGVATTILTALDRKSLVLFLLVLLVSALSIGNAAVASVRSRRTQLGVLACLGWTRRWLVRTVLTEMAIVSVAAGAASALLALVLGRVLAVPVTPARAALAVPVAVAVTLAAAAAPALAAGRACPLDALHPVVTAQRRPRGTRSLWGLAVGQVLRVRSRSLLAVAGLAVATAVTTLLLAVAVGFQGAVAGTVLGDVVAVQARGADHAAVVATLVVAGLGIADLTYLNLRDRGTEIATLRALGWSEGHLSRLLLREGALLGVAGGVIGAVAGYGAALVLVDDAPWQVPAVAVAAALTGLLVALGATVLSSRLLRGVPTLELLTDD